MKRGKCQHTFLQQSQCGVEHAILFNLEEYNLFVFNDTSDVICAARVRLGIYGLHYHLAMVIGFFLGRISSK